MRARSVSPIPQRTCVGCRETCGKTDLLRVVVANGTVVPDPAATMPGRGAYVHPRPDCVDLAVRRKSFARALRAPGGLDATELVRWINSSADR